MRRASASGGASSAFAELPALLNPGDLLVLNESRVIPARLYARRTLRREKEKPAGRIEVMLTEPAGENLWRALVRPGRKVAVGEILVFPGSAGEIALEAEVLERGQFGERLLRFKPADDFFATLDRIGHIPLPPYIRRDDEAHDRERYTLSVTAAEAINRADREGRRIVAVGTTVVRALEHCALQAKGDPLQPHSGETKTHEFRGGAHGTRLISHDMRLARFE